LPQSGLSPSYITSDAHQIEEFNGAVARRSIAAGELITSADIMRSNEGGFMSAVLTPGMRAVSISVNLTSGNAGFVFPGDKVDLLLTHKIPSTIPNDTELASETFIQNVRVLAIDQMLDNPENKAVVAKTITLEVTPKQAEMINVATNLGSISISLRSLATDSKGAPVASDKPATGATVTPAAAATPIPVTGATAPAQQDHISPGGIPYSTDSDVSKLMGDKNSVRAKVSVYHGSTNEQVDFHQQGGPPR
jgi:pilus assembly protein CpaB